MSRTDGPHPPARPGRGAHYPITRLVLIAMAVMAVLFVLTAIAAMAYVA